MNIKAQLKKSGEKKHNFTAEPAEDVSWINTVILTLGKTDCPSFHVTGHK